MISPGSGAPSWVCSGLYFHRSIMEHRRSIYESISETRPYLPPKPRVTEPIFGSQSGSEFAHLWNKAVDRTFRPVIEALSLCG